MNYSKWTKNDIKMQIFASERGDSPVLRLYKLIWIIDFCHWAMIPWKKLVLLQDQLTRMVCWRKTIRFLTETRLQNIWFIPKKGCRRSRSPTFFGLEVRTKFHAVCLRLLGLSEYFLRQELCRTLSLRFMPSLQSLNPIV